MSKTILYLVSIILLNRRQLYFNFIIKNIIYIFIGKIFGALKFISGNTDPNIISIKYTLQRFLILFNSKNYN
jgi:hypothetical protein